MDTNEKETIRPEDYEEYANIFNTLSSAISDVTKNIRWITKYNRFPQAWMDESLGHVLADLCEADDRMFSLMEAMNELHFRRALAEADAEGHA